MDWNLTYTKKNRKDENGAGKKNVGLSKLKLWTFFWGHGECEWPLVRNYIFRSLDCMYIHV